MRYIYAVCNAVNVCMYIRGNPQNSIAQWMDEAELDILARQVVNNVIVAVGEIAKSLLESAPLEKALDTLIFIAMPCHSAVVVMGMVMLVVLVGMVLPRTIVMRHSITGITAATIYDPLVERGGLTVHIVAVINNAEYWIK